MDLSDIKLGHHYRYDSTFASYSRMKVKGFTKTRDVNGDEVDVVEVSFRTEGGMSGVDSVVRPERFVGPWNPNPYPFEVGSRVWCPADKHQSRGTITDVGDGHWDSTVTVDFDGVGELPCPPIELEILAED